MSKRKDKATKLLDAFERAAARRALKGSRPADEYEDIDEEFFMARSKLQYYMDWLNKQLKQAQRQQDLLADALMPSETR